MISQITTDSVFAKVIVISFILGSNGFSVQAQVASIIAKTDIRFAPYFFARLLHGTFASILIVFLYKPLYFNRQAFVREDITVVHEDKMNSLLMVIDYILNIVPTITLLIIYVAVFILY